MKTTKRLLYVRADNSVGFSKLSLREFDAITGNGGIFAPDEVNWEIAKQIRGVPADQLEAKLAIATRWVKAVAFGGLTEAEGLQLIHDNASPINEIRTVIVEAVEIERHDRYFRNALECDMAGAVSCNMARARAWHMDQIRRIRDQELARLDKEIIKLIGKGLPITEIESQKQVLRDIPQTFLLDAYKTPAQLKASWPPGLPLL